MVNFNFRVLLTFFVSIFLVKNISWAIDEGKLLDSAEELAEKWEQMLSGGYFGVSRDKVGGWKVTKHLMVTDSLGFRIKKTDSVISPYSLVINFKTKHCGNNFHSSNANGPYYNSYSKKCGFKSAQDAISNVLESDFLDKNINSGKHVPYKVNIIDMIAIYAYQNGSWVIKSGNQNFEVFFNMHMNEKENIHYFNNLIKFPAE